MIKAAIDTIALFYLILLLWIPFYWFLFHAAIRSWRRMGNRAFWMAFPVWSIFAAGVILARKELLAHRIERSMPTWVAGAALFFAASWLDVQTRRALGWRRLVGVTELNPGHEMSAVVRAGVYARLRHPRYLLYMLMVLSMALLTGSVAIFLLAILNILMYQILAPLEERKLLEQYGPEYRDYQRAVPRFVPRLGRSPEARISS